MTPLTDLAKEIDQVDSEIKDMGLLIYTKGGVQKPSHLGLL